MLVVGGGMMPNPANVPPHYIAPTLPTWKLDTAGDGRGDSEIESLPAQIPLLPPPPPFPPAPPPTGGNDGGDAFVPGDRVIVLDGPFEEFEGRVVEVDLARRTVKVVVKIFGRDSPAELHVSQVRRI
jgi:hypothetical protein